MHNIFSSPVKGIEKLKSYFQPNNVPKEMSSSKKSDYVAQAKLCEAAQRYEDMVKYMKLAVDVAPDVNEEELNLFSYSFKTLTKLKRNQLRTISAVETNLDEGTRKKTLAKEVRDKVTDEIRRLCVEMIQTLETSLLPKVKTFDAKVCVLMMKADYLRYQAEIAPDEEKSSIANSALGIYQDAYELARTRMTPTNPIRLNLALNYSVLCFEILEMSPRACSIAKQAFDDAIIELDTLNEEAFRKATLVMKLLTDNLSMWETGHQELQQDALDDNDD